LYMLPDAFDGIQSRPWPAAEGESPSRTKARRSAMRTALERYVDGSSLNLNYDIKELGTKNVDEKMRGFWEFRSQGPMEETRLFGFFARPGAFIATDFQPRGQYESELDWLSQQTGCEARWRALCGDRPYMMAPWPVRVRADLAQYLEREDD
jgi:hypothetical protein